MILTWSAAAWVGTIGIAAATLLAAVGAGRATHDWQRVLLLVVELPLVGAMLLLWMLQVALADKIFQTAGAGGDAALLLGILGGSVLLILAAAAAVVVLLAGYTVFGRRVRFGPDLRNSLWLSRSNTWRPSDFGIGGNGPRASE
ncbi:MAG TPA: hypothetical protein VG426_08745 [Candidatus Dormibacteraeota bacterium]|nr:hypothetical protein [Candidatus Dormibacteraeota bacterium]